MRKIRRRRSRSPKGLGRCHRTRRRRCAVPDRHHRTPRRKFENCKYLLFIYERKKTVGRSMTAVYLDLVEKETLIGQSENHLFHPVTEWLHYSLVLNTNINKKLNNKTIPPLMAFVENICTVQFENIVKNNKNPVCTSYWLF